MTLTTIFDHANPAHRELKSWRTAGKHSWQTNAKRYAALHGEAKVWRADGSVLCFRHDAGKHWQRTYRHVIHANQ